MRQYDRIADDYVRIKKFNPADHYCFYPRFYETIGDVKGRYVLDLASDEGKIAREMSSRGASEVVIPTTAIFKAN